MRIRADIDHGQLNHNRWFSVASPTASASYYCLNATSISALAHWHEPALGSELLHIQSPGTSSKRRLDCHATLWFCGAGRPRGLAMAAQQRATRWRPGAGGAVGAVGVLPVAAVASRRRPPWTGR